MLLHFNLHYQTEYGEQIGIQYYSENGKDFKMYFFQTHDGQNWSGMFEVKDKSSISYIYCLFKNGDVFTKEWGKVRTLKSGKSGQVYLLDKWRPRANENNSFLTTAFTESIFKRPKTVISVKKKALLKNSVTFCLRSSKIQPHLKYGVVGNIPDLGSWDKPVWMDDKDFPLWELTIPIKGTEVQIEYKYVVLNPVDNSIKI